jgi:hypothetical protein
MSNTGISILLAINIIYKLFRENPINIKKNEYFSTTLKVKMSKEWKNYDFGKNWETILHHIKGKKIQRMLNKMINMYQYTDYKYPPAMNFTSNDSHIMLVEHVFNHAKEKKDKRVPIKMWKQLNKAKNERFFELYDKIVELLGYNYQKNQDHLAFYVPFGGCHIYNPKISFILARKIYPEFKWKVIRGEHHTTVICEEQDMVFDIIYFGLDGRLFDYSIGIDYKSSDKTLGGLEAVTNSGYLTSLRKNPIKN